MITEKTATLIARAYAEIRAGEKLLGETEESVARGESADLRDAFGRQRGIEMAVPHSNDSSRRLFDVAPRLAGAVIHAHLGEKRAELEALNVQAWREADGSAMAKGGAS